MAGDYLITISENINPDLIGTKAKNLYWLSKGGFNLPSTYFLISKAYDDFIIKNKLKAGINNILRDKQLTHRDKSQKIRHLIIKAEIPEELQVKL